MIEHGLRKGLLLKRYKRFLADVQFEDNSIVTVHCPNPGSMIGCSEPGSEVFLRYSAKSTRKLAYTLVCVMSSSPCQKRATPVIVDTLMANKLVKESIVRSQLEEFRHYSHVSSEPRFKDGRFDLKLELNQNSGSRSALLEIKSTTLVLDGRAMFPDARTERGRKHLLRLLEARAADYRAVQIFVVTRSDIDSFSPAAHIDPDYDRILKEVARAGVEVLAYRTEVILAGPGDSGAVSAKDSECYSLDLTLGAPIPVFLD